MDFMLLRSDKFGTKDYRKNTTRHAATLKKVHKRNFIDSLNRKFNSNFKSLNISKSEFQGEWPFYVDNEVIECRYKYWCVFSIDGFDYALNGSAKGRYKLEHAHAGVIAVLGKSTGDFIQIALNLSK